MARLLVLTDLQSLLDCSKELTPTLPPSVGAQGHVCEAPDAPTAEHVCSTVATSDGGARDGCGAHSRFLGLERVRGRMAAVCRDAPRRPCRRAPRCDHPDVSAMRCFAWGE